MEKKQAGVFATVKHFLSQDLWVLDPSPLSKARRRGLHFLRVCALVYKGFKEDKCPLHAAALTFITVMALVPFLVILFAIARGIGFERGSELLLEKASEMPEGLQAAVNNIISTVESASAGALGGIGGILFMWVAIKMLSNIEETFNVVWGVRVPRTLVEKIKNYIIIMVAAPVLMIVATTAQPVLMGFTSKLEWMGPFLKLGLQLVPVLTMALAFMMVYLFLPNTKVKVGPAFTGSLVAALLSVGFQYAILNLGVGVSKYNKIYGALAAIPIFLFWVQMSWMILLMGAEVAFSVQNAGTYAREQLAVSPSSRARLCLAVALMKRNHRKPLKTPDAPFKRLSPTALKKRIPVRLIRDVIKHTGRGRAGRRVRRGNLTATPCCATRAASPPATSPDAILDNGARADRARPRLRASNVWKHHR